MVQFTKQGGLQRSIAFLMLFLALSAGRIAHAQYEDEPFHVFFHAEEKDVTTGSFHTVSAGSYQSLKEAGEVKKRFSKENGESMLPNGNHVPMNITVIVPKGAPESYRKAFAAEVKKQFSDHLAPGQEIIIEESFVDVPEVIKDLERLEADATEALPHTTNNEGRRRLEAAITYAQVEKKKVFNWSLIWKAPYEFFTKTILSPKHEGKAKIAVALLKGATAFYVLASTYGINMWSSLIIATRVGVTMWFGYNAVKFSNWVQTHKFFLSGVYTWLEKFAPIRIYNNNPTVKFFTWNTAFDFVVAELMQTVAYVGDLHVDGVAPDHPLSPKFLGKFFGLSTLEKFGDMGYETGLRRLNQKRAIDWTKRGYVIWAFTFLDNYMHSKFGAQKYLQAYAIGGISYVLKGAVWALGFHMKPKAREIIIVSGRIPKFTPDPTKEDPKRVRLNDDFDFLVRRYSLDEALELGPEMDLKLNQDPELRTDYKKFASMLNGGHLPIPQVLQIQRDFFDGPNSKARGSIVRSCARAAILAAPSK